MLAELFCQHNSDKINIFALPKSMKCLDTNKFFALWINRIYNEK